MHLEEGVIFRALGDSTNAFSTTNSPGVVMLP
jgi:hypothetical protein